MAKRTQKTETRLAIELGEVLDGHNVGDGLAALALITSYMFAKAVPLSQREEGLRAWIDEVRSRALMMEKKL